MNLSAQFHTKLHQLFLSACFRRQGNKLRRLMTFAWPCLVLKNCVDPATKYHGHLLLSHIIAKFAIHKRIVLQVTSQITSFHRSNSELLPLKNSIFIPKILFVFFSIFFLLFHFQEKNWSYLNSNFTSSVFWSNKNVRPKMLLILL